MKINTFLPCDVFCKETLFTQVTLLCQSDVYKTRLLFNFCAKVTFINAFIVQLTLFRELNRSDSCAEVTCPSDAYSITIESLCDNCVVLIAKL